MKFLLLALFVFSQAAFAYHTHTAGSVVTGSRDPSSIVEKPKK